MSLLYRLARPALFRFEAERAHKLSMGALKRGLVRDLDIPVDGRLHVEVAGIRFPNPIGLAAGYDKNAEVPDELLRLGFGFVEMPNQEEANRAVEALGGTDFHGRPLTVNEARRNTGRNTANLSRSAHRPDSDEAERGSTGYAAKPDTPKPTPDQGDAEKDDAPVDDQPVQDDEGEGETPTNGGYRNDRV
mgnify:CR=1 FL=1